MFNITVPAFNIDSGKSRKILGGIAPRLDLYASDGIVSSCVRSSIVRLFVLIADRISLIILCFSSSVIIVI